MNFLMRLRLTTEMRRCLNSKSNLNNLQKPTNPTSRSLNHLPKLLLYARFRMQETSIDISLISILLQRQSKNLMNILKLTSNHCMREILFRRRLKEERLGSKRFRGDLLRRSFPTEFRSKRLEFLWNRRSNFMIVDRKKANSKILHEKSQCLF